MKGLIAKLPFNKPLGNSPSIIKGLLIAALLALSARADASNPFANPFPYSLKPSTSKSAAKQKNEENSAVLSDSDDLSSSNEKISREPQLRGIIGTVGGLQAIIAWQGEMILVEEQNDYAFGRVVEITSDKVNILQNGARTLLLLRNEENNLLLAK